LILAFNQGIIDPDMYHPTTRLLTIIELLQIYPMISGTELAEKLDVNVRTVRRYVTMLQDIGLPIEAERGRDGGYRLRPGFKLPPMMFNQQEALAIALGLALARRLGLGVEREAVEGASAKLERVLPDDIRSQLQALQSILVLDLPIARTDPATEKIIALGAAVVQQKTIRLTYHAWNDRRTVRLVDPYGLVYRAGFWYAPGYCHLREAVRTFRLDRIEAVELLEDAFERPSDFDSLAYVNQAMATTPGIWHIDVLLKTTLPDAQRQIPPALGTLTAESGGTALNCYVQDIFWFAHFLVGLECTFCVRKPVELRAALSAIATKAAKLAAAK
jgi:predicted DNA-binding transcriptional regulator YafY